MRGKIRLNQRGLIKAYVALHEGVAPKEISRVRLPAQPTSLIELGPLTDVVYEKDTPDGRIKYHHPFAKGARPVLVRDERGKLHVIHGSYVVNERGIVDVNNRRSSEMKRRNLFSFGKKRSSKRARRNPTAILAGSRPNPSGRSMEFAKKIAIAGASAAAFELVTEIALTHVAAIRTKLDTNAKRQGAQAIVGGVLALVGHRYAPTVALGIGAAAFANGVQAVLEVTSVREYLDSLFAPAPSGALYGRVGSVRALPAGGVSSSVGAARQPAFAAR